MNNESDILKFLSEKERNLDLYKVKVGGVSLWKLVRIPIVRNYILKKHGIGKNDNRNVSRGGVNILEIVLMLAKSLVEVMINVVFTRRKVDSIIFSFPRLQEVNGQYIDKFTDPLIELSNISNSYLIFQRNHAGKHYSSRYNKENTIRIDIVKAMSQVCVILALPLFLFLCFFKSLELFFKSKSVFELRFKSVFNFFVTSSVFIVEKEIYKIIFRLLRVKQIFVVNREIHYAQILACKALGVKVYEIQHGVTHGWTVLYSSFYEEQSGVDEFLSFGSYWSGKQFGMPVSKINNIGWAYKKFIESKLLENRKSDAILVVSDSVERMAAALRNIASQYADVEFHIRPHPQEVISSSLEEFLFKLPNVKLVCNKVESIIALSSYRSVMGVSSSVLFEALSFNLNVGVINMPGCETSIPLANLLSAFHVINDMSGFERFLSNDASGENDTSIFYGQFDDSKVNGLLV